MKRYAIGIGLIALAVGTLQGRSVRHGLLLDDYSHRAELREGDWSFRSLVAASHLGGHRRRVEMWWQQDADLYFFRPVSFLIVRVEYVLGGWRPEVMHACSLAWAVLCATLVMVLAKGATGSVRWATLAGVLFALHPANYPNAQWVACQNQLIVTAFCLCGLVFYARDSGWAPADESDRPGPSLTHRLLALTCFVLALGCRESGIVFGPVVVVGDWLLRPGRFKGRWATYAAIAGITVAYLVVRHVALGGFTMPGRPYFYPPGTPGFARFVVDKFIYYMLGLFLYFPIVGFSGLRFLRAHPMLFYGSFALLVLIGGLLLWWFRRRRYLLLALAACVVPILPALPVYAASHHVYLASVGMVIAMVGVWQALAAWGARRASVLGKTVWAVVAVLIVVHVAGFATTAAAYDIGMAGFSAANQLPIDDVVRFGRPMKPHDRLFFINLPLLGFNCIPAIEEATGVSPLKGYVLTFAPNLLGMTRRGYVERVGRNQLRVWLDDDGYFSELSGEKIMEAAGRDRPFTVGETFSTDDFKVRVTRGSPSGIAELVFTFQRPLDDPSYHFFFGSRVWYAYPLRFERKFPSTTASLREARLGLSD